MIILIMIILILLLIIIIIINNDIDNTIITIIIIIIIFSYEVLISGVQSFAFHEAAAGAEHVIVSTAMFHTKNC